MPDTPKARSITLDLNHVRSQCAKTGLGFVAKAAIHPGRANGAMR
jgi:hypothetical protein